MPGAKNEGGAYLADKKSAKAFGSKTKKLARILSRKVSDEKDVYAEEKEKDNKDPDKKIKERSQIGFVDHVFKLGIKGLLIEYQSMKRTVVIDPNRMHAFITAAPTGKNRYKDVGCLDCSRVLIDGTNYIHANYVKNVNKSGTRFICTQGPVTKTVIDFWTMVCQEQVNSIVMLCDFVENNHNKCTVYFPLEPGRSMPLDENVSIMAVERYQHTFKVTTQCVLMITKLEVKWFDKTTICTHYHWMEWPDRGVPDPDLAAVELLGLVRQNGKEPFVIHCSAGIGRTGSIVLLDYLLDSFNSGNMSESAAQYLKDIRAQREGAIQTDQQYLWVHIVFLRYLKKRHLLSDSDLEKMKTFISDYSEVAPGAN